MPLYAYASNDTFDTIFFMFFPVFHPLYLFKRDNQPCQLHIDNILP